MAETAPAPLVTVITVSFNSSRWLARLLAALESQTEQRFRFVLIDNASNPAERPDPRALPAWVEVMQSPTNLGFAQANNVAAAGATTPFLAFLNPDAFPAPDWLAALVHAAGAHPQAAAFGATQWRADSDGVLDGTGDVLHASGLAYRSGYGIARAPPETGETFSACAAAMLVRREAFAAIGGFDARYFCYFEDVDLGFRLRLLGWRCVQVRAAEVAHVGGGAAGARSAFGDFHGARNRFWTFVKCMPSALFWSLLPAHAVITAAVASVHVLQGRGFSSWRGVLAGLSGLATFWRARGAVQRARTASTMDIARALAWDPRVLVGRQPVIRASADRR